MASGPQSDMTPESDIYTVLVMVGVVFLVAGTIVISARAQALFGSWMPFNL